MNDVAVLIADLGLLAGGISSLLTAVRLWQKAKDNHRQAEKEALESERVEELEYQLAVRERELHVCEEAIEAYRKSRWNWEQK